MFDIRTDHQIVPFGTNKMGLFDTEGNSIVVAQRDHDRAPWQIHTDSDGIPDMMKDTREEAITAMVDFALQSLPGTGYSCLVPHGLAETP